MTKVKLSPFPLFDLIISKVFQTAVISRASSRSPCLILCQQLNLSNSALSITDLVGEPQLCWWLCSSIPWQLLPRRGHVYRYCPGKPTQIKQTEGKSTRSVDCVLMTKLLLWFLFNVSQLTYQVWHPMLCVVVLSNNISEDWCCEILCGILIQYLSL